MANAIELLAIDELAEDLRLLRKFIFEIPFMREGVLESLLKKPNNAFSYLTRDGEELYINLTLTKERIMLAQKIKEAERKYGKTS